MDTARCEGSTKANAMSLPSGIIEKFANWLGGGEAVVSGDQGRARRSHPRRRTNSGKLTVIEVKVPRDDISPQLARIGLEVARRRGWKVPARPGKEGSHS